MRLTFVGHASVLVEAGGIAILTDPWLTGDAFNDSWTPHPQPVLRPADLARVTHVWVSHEHPDHLSIPTLRSFPDEVRARITVLSQRHLSDEVTSFLGRLGFGAVEELAHGRWVAPAPGVEVVMHQVGHEDSALTVRSGGTTVLDLNDCKPSPGTLRRIRRQIGPVDVLLDQFSIAGRPGNPGDTAAYAARRHHVLDELVRQDDVVGARWLVPMASFVRFSHEENAYMNDAVNTIDDVAAAVGPERLAVLFPGDAWDVDAGPFPGTGDAIARYRTARETIADLPLRRHDPVPFTDVVAAMASRTADLHRAYHEPVLRRLQPLTFDLADLGRAVELDVAARTVVEVVPGHGRCVVHLSSQAAHHTFSQRWGLPTLLISGRFRLTGDEEPFRRLKQLGSAWSSGFHTRGAARALTGDRGRDAVLRRARGLTADVLGRIGRNHAER